MTSAEMAIAYRAARSVSRRVHGSEFDNLYSDAVLAVWRGTQSFDGSGKRENYLFLCGVQGVIDGLRHRYGRPGSARYTGNWNTMPTGDQGAVDSRPVDLELRVDFLIEDLTRGNRRVALILHRLAEGKNKEEIAEELGVTPSRVCQLLRKVKERVELGLAA